MTLYLLLCVLAGWLLGGIGNWVADHLPCRRSGPLPSPIAAWPHYWTLWWYWRRSTCPHCGTPRPWRAPLLEVGTVVALAISGYFLSDRPLILTVVGAYATFLLVVLVIDLEHRRVLNVMLVPMAALVLLFSLLPGMPGLTSAILGGVVGFTIFAVMYLIGRGKLGAGDVKLAGVIGLMTGYPGVWAALVLGTSFGALAALWLLITRRASRKTYMAYAPYLSLGALIALWSTFAS